MEGKIKKFNLKSKPRIIFQQTRILKKHSFIVAILVCIALSTVWASLLVLKKPTIVKAANITCNGVACNPDILALSENSDVVIDGQTAVISGSHTFKSLTIMNNGSLTHAPLLITDLNTALPSTDPNYIRPTGKLKKIDIKVTGDIVLQSGGSIIADEKGYPGGNFTVTGCNGAGKYNDGYGPGKGLKYFSSDGAQAGGAGYGGTGGNGTLAGNGGLPYLPGTYPELQYGSGGGAAYSGHYHGGWTKRHDCGHGQGGQGGGLINLDITGDLRFEDANTRISAKGAKQTNISENTSGAAGGGGAGGTVNIVANGSIIYTYDSFQSATYYGADYLTPSRGSMNITQVHSIGLKTLYAISVNGGSGGGAGAGGQINVVAENIKRECVIKSGSKIPAICEGEVVVLDGIKGGLKIYADEIAVPQSPVMATRKLGCSDSSDVTCDTKRKFLSLTIKNNAILTYHALEIADMSQDLDVDYSLVDETKGAARWKKVDIMVKDINSIVLQSGGKIDTDGLGYPGGVPECHTNWGYSRPGYGPGAGGTSGGGGSFGALGGKNSGSIYENPNPLLAIDFGSGGGSYYGHSWHKRIWGGGSNHWTCPIGGAGGGRIHLNTPTLSMVYPSSLSAKGKNGEYKTMEDDKGWAGGGSGGSIWLGVDTYDIDKNMASANGGLDGGQNTLNINPTSYHVGDTSVNGGNGGDSVGGGGGGGRLEFGPYMPDFGIEVTLQDEYGTGMTGKTITLSGQSNHITNSNSKTYWTGLTQGNYTVGCSIAKYICDPIETTALGWDAITVTLIAKRINTLTGDVHAQDEVKMGNFQIQSNAIVAGGSITGPANPCASTATNCKKLAGYSIDFTSFDTTLKKTINQLRYQQAKPVASLDLALAPNWNLNSSGVIGAAFNPVSNPQRSPEGGVWVVGSPTSPGNLTLTQSVAYQNRGTIIVNDLTINNVNLAPDGNAQLGFIVLGNLIINPSNALQTIQAGIYVDNSVTIKERSKDHGLNFTGYIVARYNINLPAAGAGSSLIYNPLISPASPKVALPGFAKLLSSVTKTISP